MSPAGRITKIVKIGDFAYFVAVAVPYAELDRYRIFSDCIHWVFPFDDIFDIGELKDDPAVAKKVLDNLVESMKGEDIPQTEFVEAHQDICMRMKKTTTQNTYNRFIKVIFGYCSNVYNQVRSCSEGEILKPNELIKIRRDTIGVRPRFIFIEFSHELELPDEVMAHPLIEEIETLGVDWVLIQNDMLSYRQEEEEGVNHNLISANRLHGIGAQQAFDDLGSRLDRICARFDEAVVELPSFGDTIDREIEKYVEGIKDCVKANLHWSFRTKRYFGSERDVVKKTGRLDVLRAPSYLSMATGIAAGVRGEARIRNNTYLWLIEKSTILVGHCCSDAPIPLPRKL